jgi:uncharacterized protein (TIGR03000 family)
MYSVVLMIALSSGGNEPGHHGGVDRTGAICCEPVYQHCHGRGSGCTRARSSLWQSFTCVGHTVFGIACDGYPSRWGRHRCSGCSGSCWGHGYGCWSHGYGCWGDGPVGCSGGIRAHHEVGSEGDPRASNGEIAAAVTPNSDTPVADMSGASLSSLREIARDPNAAILIVELPPAAKLTIDDTTTRALSNRREFVSPPLEPGAVSYYTLKAEIARDGQTFIATRRVAVRAGQETHVSLQDSWTVSPQTEQGFRLSQTD